MGSLVSIFKFTEGLFVKIKKTAAAVCSIVLFAGTAGWNGIVSAEENTVTVLSIGDSITDGYGTDGSYRKFMYRELSESGYSIDMTGPNWSWGDAEYTDAETGEKFSYDAAHCGYSGYAIEEYSGRNGIREMITSGNYLSEYNPDIVILQIGTNDVIDNHEIDTAGERLDTLVTYILENISDDSALFVTTIPNLDPNREEVYPWFSNYRHSADWTVEYSDEEAEQAVQNQTDSYNEQVRALVKSKQENGVNNIFLGEINGVVDDVKTQLKDGVHPNDTGYKLMGHYWAEQLRTWLGGSAETPPDEPVPAEPVTGDVSDDGAVSSADFVLLQKYLLGISEISENQKKNTDINEDELINIADFILLKNMIME